MLRTLLLVSDPLDAPIWIENDLNALQATLTTLPAADFVVQIAEDQWQEFSTALAAQAETWRAAGGAAQQALTEG